MARLLLLQPLLLLLLPPMQVLLLPLLLLYTSTPCGLLTICGHAVCSGHQLNGQVQAAPHGAGCAGHSLCLMSCQCAWAQA